MDNLPPPAAAARERVIARRRAEAAERGEPDPHPDKPVKP